MRERERDYNREIKIKGQREIYIMRERAITRERER